jgi:hypothetical protein
MLENMEPGDVEKRWREWLSMGLLFQISHGDDSWTVCLLIPNRFKTNCL